MPSLAPDTSLNASDTSAQTLIQLQKERCLIARSLSKTRGRESTNLSGSPNCLSSSSIDTSKFSVFPPRCSRFTGSARLLRLKEHAVNPQQEPLDSHEATRVSDELLDKAYSSRSNSRFDDGRFYCACLR